MNPWNLRSALLARHAQHVVLIHFPIALFFTGVLFDVAASLMPVGGGNRKGVPNFGGSTLVGICTPPFVGPLAEPRDTSSSDPQSEHKTGLTGAEGLPHFGSRTRRSDLAAVSFWNLTVAAASAIPAAISGLLAWQWELEGRRVKGVLLLHLLFAIASLLLMGSVWLVHQQSRRRGQEPSRLRWPLEAAAVVVVTLTGHLGGFLSGVNHS